MGTKRKINLQVKNATKEKLRKELELATEEFLKQGGKIKKVIVLPEDELTCCPYSCFTRR